MHCCRLMSFSNCNCGLSECLKSKCGSNLITNKKVLLCINISYMLYWIIIHILAALCWSFSSSKEKSINFFYFCQVCLPIWSCTAAFCSVINRRALNLREIKTVWSMLKCPSVSFEVRANVTTCQCVSPAKWEFRLRRINHYQSLSEQSWTKAVIQRKQHHYI